MNRVREKIPVDGSYRQPRQVELPKPYKPVHVEHNGKWTCVLTTAPRPNPTIEASLTSVSNAGWNPIVFAEPDSIVVPGYEYKHNKQRLGVWHNWLHAAKWAMKHSNSDLILMMQDDCTVHPESKAFVESMLWPSTKTGFISLYTPKHYSMDLSGTLKPLGIRRVFTSSLWGACALVFHRYTLDKIVYSPIAASWLGVPPANISDSDKKRIREDKQLNPYKIQNADTAIGKIINSLAHEMYFIDPSPAYHIATHSAVGHGGNTGKRNCLRGVDFTLPLRQQVFPDEKH